VVVDIYPGIDEDFAQIGESRRDTAEESGFAWGKGWLYHFYVMFHLYHGLNDMFVAESLITHVYMMVVSYLHHVYVLHKSCSE
jgi:hypothetical protein